MSIIGTTRIEGIDWIQDQLDGISRPLAEQTYFALCEREIIVESGAKVSLTRRISEAEIRSAGMEAEDERDNRHRSQARMSRRRSTHNSRTTMRQMVKQGNSIDCVNEDGNEAK